MPNALNHPAQPALRDATVRILQDHLDNGPHEPGPHGCIYCNVARGQLAAAAGEEVTTVKDFTVAPEGETDENATDLDADTSVDAE